MQTSDSTERRAEERHLKFSPLNFSDTFLEGSDVIPAGGDGQTYDVSPSGLCFRTNRPVEHMMPIRLVCPELWDEPRNGTVRWCAQIGVRAYRVGVTFAEPIALPKDLSEPVWWTEALMQSRPKSPA